MLLRLFVLVFAALLATGCQTSMLRSFEKIHPGMDKHQVLESLGSPNATTRMHGRDRWIYRFYEDGIRFDKEVHFLDGFAVYSGEPWVPEAEKTAQKKDEESAKIEADYQASEKARADEKRKNAELFEQHENEARNRDKVRYVPDFVEIK